MPRSDVIHNSSTYKNVIQRANVKVIDVIWNICKDGILFPKIHIERTMLSHTYIEFVPGFNAKFIVDNNIGPNAILTIVKSGGVIPYVTGIIQPAENPGLPQDYDYKWDNDGINIFIVRPT
jgi:DNA ligase (NAD+)